MAKKNKLLIKIGVSVLAVIFFLTCALFVVDSFAPANPKCYDKFLLSTFNGSYDAEGLPKTYWQVEPRQDAEGNRVPSIARFSLTTVDIESVGQIWINISDLKEKEAKITIVYGNTALTVSGTTVITAKQLKESQDGWIKVYDSTDANFKTFTTKFVGVGFENEVRVREIAFKDINGKAPEKVEVRGLSIGLSEDDAKPIPDNNVNKVADEQKTFTK